MEKLVFKSFIWPRNPDTYREDWSRKGVYHTNSAGENVFDGMDVKCCHRYLSSK